MISPHGRGAPRPAKDRDLAEEVPDPERRLLSAVELDRDLAGGDEIHRLRSIAAADDDVAGIRRLRPQQPHDLGDRRGVEPVEQRHPRHHAPGHDEIPAMNLFREGGRDDADR